MSKFVEPDDDSYSWHKKLLVPDISQNLKDEEFLEGYRRTWPLRTKSMKSANAKLERLMPSYPLLIRKEYVRVGDSLCCYNYISWKSKYTCACPQLDIEAEEYFGGDDANKKQLLLNYKTNVRATWQAIRLLNTAKV